MEKTLEDKFYDEFTKNPLYKKFIEERVYTDLTGLLHAIAKATSDNAADYMYFNNALKGSEKEAFESTNNLVVINEILTNMGLEEEFRSVLKSIIDQEKDIVLRITKEHELDTRIGRIEEELKLADVVYPMLELYYSDKVLSEYSSRLLHEKEPNSYDDIQLLLNEIYEKSKNLTEKELMELCKILSEAFTKLYMRQVDEKIHQDIIGKKEYTSSANVNFVNKVLSVTRINEEYFEELKSRIR